MYEEVFMYPAAVGSVPRTLCSRVTWTSRKSVVDARLSQVVGSELDGTGVVK
jgi:hypothetical protein